MIAEEGTPGDTMFILYDGEVVVEKATRGGNQVELARFPSRGDFFGEMAFVDVMPRSATLRSSRETKLLVFKLEALCQFFERHREAYLSMMLNIARILSKRLCEVDAEIAELKSN